MQNSCSFGIMQNRIGKTSRCNHQRAVAGGQLSDLDSFCSILSDYSDVRCRVALSNTSTSASVIAIGRLSSMCSVASDHFAVSSSSTSYPSPLCSITINTKVMAPMGEQYLPVPDNGYDSLAFYANDEQLPKDEGTTSAKSPSVKRSQFFKTKLCPWFVKGRCFLENGCNYAHSHEELRRKPDLSRTTLCPMLLHNRECTQSRCRYAHSVEELRATSSLFKTRVCKYWKKGFCPAGIECRHAHGEQEVRNPSETPRLDSLKNSDSLNDETCSRSTITNETPASRHESSQTTSPVNSASDYISSPRPHHDSPSPPSVCAGGPSVPYPIFSNSATSSPPPGLTIQKDIKSFRTFLEPLQSLEALPDAATTSPFQLLPKSEIIRGKEEPESMNNCGATRTSDGQPNTYVDAFLQLVRLSLTGELKHPLSLDDSVSPVRISNATNNSLNDSLPDTFRISKPTNNATSTATTIWSQTVDPLPIEQDSFFASLHIDNQCEENAKRFSAPSAQSGCNDDFLQEVLTKVTYQNDSSSVSRKEIIQNKNSSPSLNAPELSAMVMDVLQDSSPETPWTDSRSSPMMYLVHNRYPLGENSLYSEKDPVGQDQSRELFALDDGEISGASKECVTTHLEQLFPYSTLSCALESYSSCVSSAGGNFTQSLLQFDENSALVSSQTYRGKQGKEKEPQRNVLSLVSSASHRPGAPDVASQLWSMPTMGLSLGGTVVAQF